MQPVWHITCRIHELSPQVLRRASYKGQNEAPQDGSLSCLKLPVDVATIPGHLACVACMLQNRGCTALALKEGLNAIKVWDAHLQICRRFPLLPNVPGTDIVVAHNRISLEQLQGAFRAAQLEGYLPIIVQQLVAHSHDLFIPRMCLALPLSAEVLSEQCTGHHVG